MCTDCLHETHMSYAESPSLQIAQALAVSMNKLGDQRYLSGDLHGAKQHYLEALRTRQGCCSPSKPASVESHLGVATSLLKVLDIEQVSACPTHADGLRLGMRFMLAALHRSGSRLHPEMLMSARVGASHSEDRAVAMHRVLLTKGPNAHVASCCGQATYSCTAFPNRRAHVEPLARCAAGGLLQELNMKEKQVGHPHAEPHDPTHIENRIDL